jgi:hypothetical protein
MPLNPDCAIEVDSEHDLRFLRKLSQFPGCHSALSNLLYDLHNNITSSNSSIAASTRALFGFPASMSSASALFIVYESLELMNGHNDEFHFLTTLCKPPLTITSLSNLSKAALASAGLYGPDLDPDKLANETCSPTVRDRKQIWKIQCLDLGQFNIPSISAPYFRSPLLNRTFYENICSSLWNTSGQIGSADVTNLRFGGRNSRAQSILFTMNQDDVLLHLMLEEPKNWTEIFKLNVSIAGSPGADLRAPQPDEHPNLTQQREEAIGTIVSWMNGTWAHGSACCTPVSAMTDLQERIVPKSRSRQQDLRRLESRRSSGRFCSCSRRCSRGIRFDTTTFTARWYWHLTRIKK